MKLIETRYLRGPNLFHTRPCFQAVLDLEELEDRPSTEFEGFTDRLVAALPTLEAHRCSRGHTGGFIERLREGTYMAHIVEHVAIELQCLAGTRVGYGRARSIRGKPGHYRVIVEYQLESLVGPAFEAALEKIQALCRGEQIDFSLDLAQLKEIVADAALGPSTGAIVEAARRRGIPYQRVTENASLIQLGWGKHQKRIQATVTSNTSHIAVELASDKHLTKMLLQEAGVPVPRGDVVRTAEAAVAVARRIGLPVVVKGGVDRRRLARRGACRVRARAPLSFARHCRAASAGRGSSRRRRRGPVHGGGTALAA
jgi:cyanophycin synthetase